jgi:uncharacterized membrane protein YqiK
MKRDIFLERYKKHLSIGALIVLVIFILLLSWFVGKPMVKFVSQPEAFRAWVEIGRAHV